MNFRSLQRRHYCKVAIHRESYADGVLSLEESVKLMGVADNYQEEIERIRQMKEASATSIYEDAKTNLSTKKDENSSINTPTE